jgi:hypothetical protein
MTKTWLRTGITLEQFVLNSRSELAKSIGISRHRLCVDAITRLLSNEKTSESLQERV